jgi:hypothetical protein
MWYMDKFGSVKRLRSLLQPLQCMSTLLLMLLCDRAVHLGVNAVSHSNLLLMQFRPRHAPGYQCGTDVGHVKNGCLQVGARAGSADGTLAGGIICIVAYMPLVIDGTLNGTLSISGRLPSMRGPGNLPARATEVPRLGSQHLQMRSSNQEMSFVDLNDDIRAMEEGHAPEVDAKTGDPFKSYHNPYARQEQEETLATQSVAAEAVIKPALMPQVFNLIIVCFQPCEATFAFHVLLIFMHIVMCDLVQPLACQTKALCSRTAILNLHQICLLLPHQQFVCATLRNQQSPVRGVNPFLTLQPRLMQQQKSPRGR